MVVRLAQQEEVDHHLLGGGVERRGLQPQLLRDLLDVEQPVLQLREVAQLRLDERPVVGVHEDAHLEAVVGAEVPQAVQVLPGARGLLRDHRAQALPFLQVDRREAAELDLAIAEIRLPHRVAGREGDEQRVREEQVELVEEDRAEDGGGVDPRERHLEALDDLQPHAQHFGVGDRGVEDAVVAPRLGLASLQQRMAVGRVAEDLRELPREDRLAVARAQVRDRVEPEILLGEVGEDVRGHVLHRREVELEGGGPGPGDRELAPRDDALALRDEAHEARVGEVEEVPGHGQNLILPITS